MNAAKQWAAKVDRAATDSARIERRKRIAPALIVERTVTYLSSESLDAMEASDSKVPESHAIRAKELRERFMVTESPTTPTEIHGNI